MVVTFEFKLLLTSLLLARMSSAKKGPVSVDFNGSQVSGLSYDGVEAFNGIPFAAPPVGHLRLKPPRALSQVYRHIDGTRPSPACS